MSIATKSIDFHRRVLHRYIGERLWVIAALSLGPAVSNSFARFAYALILPAMRSDLGLTYSQAGALNTANAIGYIAGAVLAACYASRVGNRRLFSVGMVVTAVAILGCGLSGYFSVQMILRAIAGVSGALVFISGVVLVSNVYPDRPDRASTAMAVYFSGAGLGLVLSGVGIPVLLSALGDHGWHAAWLAAGALSSIFAVLAICAANRIVEPATGARQTRWPMGEFRASLASYFLVGAGYIGYMTFAVTWMRSQGASTLDVAATWGTLGIATIIAPLAWRVPRSRWRPQWNLAAASAVIGLGAVIPLFSASLAWMLLSALLFGGAMFTAPGAVTDLVKASLPRATWGPAVALYTVVFAAGQAIGPVLSGWVGDRMKSLPAGLALSVVFLLAACVSAMFQRSRVVQTRIAPVAQGAG